MHVLIVGAGGLGCPAAYAALAAGHRVRIVDPDRVEVSNLPRQVLFAEGHVGAPKARAAAEVLRDWFGPEAQVEGVAARADDTTIGDLLAGVEVVLDATDGARTKDWLCQMAVRRGVPLVHAAGLRAEGRLLPIPAGGRPCLACLFGRLEIESGSCADLGVWNGVVGTVGALAAGLAARLTGPTPPSAAYAVLDFEAGRALSLGAQPAAACPVCSDAARAEAVEPYPDAVDCAVTGTAASAEAPPRVDVRLDLSHERCPMNLLRAREALARLPIGTQLEIHLGAEGARTVPGGITKSGHAVLWQTDTGEGLRLVARRGPETESALEGQAPRAHMDRDAMARFARQLVLPDLGSEGQVGFAAARVRIHGDGHAARLAALYLAAAGVGTVVIDGARDDPWFARLRARSTGRILSAGSGPDETGADVVLALGGEAAHHPEASLRVVERAGTYTLRLGPGRSAAALPAFCGPWIADAAERRLVARATGRALPSPGTFALTESEGVSPA